MKTILSDKFNENSALLALAFLNQAQNWQELLGNQLVPEIPKSAKRINPIREDLAKQLIAVREQAGGVFTSLDQLSGVKGLDDESLSFLATSFHDRENPLEVLCREACMNTARRTIESAADNFTICRHEAGDDPEAKAACTIDFRTRVRKAFHSYRECLKGCFAEMEDFLEPGPEEGPGKGPQKT